MFKLLHIEYLLEEIEELLLGHHLVTQHCCGQSLTRASGLVLWKLSCENSKTERLRD